MSRSGAREGAGAGQARADLDVAAALVSKLADGASGVADAKKRFAAPQALYGKLDAILTGTPPAPAPQPTPAPQPGPAPQPSPAPQPAPAKPEKVELRYPHADHLKSAEFNLRRVEGDAAGLAALLDELRPRADQLGAVRPQPRRSCSAMRRSPSSSASAARTPG